MEAQSNGHVQDMTAPVIHLPRLLLIFNPTAGQHRRRSVQAAAMRLGAAWNVTLAETTGRGDAERFAATARGRGFAGVAVAGGDGTINEAINGLARAPLPLGILPMGTANVLAHELGIGDDLDRAIDTLLAGEARPVHLGSCNGRLFTMMCGIGFDAHVVRNVDIGLKRRTGKLAYVWQSLKELLRHRPTAFDISLDGGRVPASGAMIIANGHYYGGTFVACRDARLDRPDLQVCRVPPTGPLSVIRYAARLGLGVLDKAGDVAVAPAARIDIDGPAGEPVQCDGDITGTTPATIVADAARLAIFQPRPAG